jgi:hypothetical protein
MVTVTKLNQTNVCNTGNAGNHIGQRNNNLEGKQDT